MWLLRLIIPVILMGVAVPLYKGFEFFDSGLLMFYALSPLLLAPAALFDRGNMLRAAALTALIPLASVALGIGVVNANAEYRVIPRGTFLAAIALLSVASALFGVALKSRLARWLGSPERARRLVLAALSMVLILKILGVPLIPAEHTTTNSLIAIATGSSLLMLCACVFLVRP